MFLNLLQSKVWRWNVYTLQTVDRNPRSTQSIHCCSHHLSVWTTNRTCGGFFSIIQIQTILIRILDEKPIAWKEWLRIASDHRAPTVPSRKKFKQEWKGSENESGKPREVSPWYFEKPGSQHWAMSWCLWGRKLVATRTHWFTYNLISLLIWVKPQIEVGGTKNTTWRNWVVSVPVYKFFTFK